MLSNISCPVRKHLLEAHNFLLDTGFKNYSPISGKKEPAKLGTHHSVI